MDRLLSELVDLSEVQYSILEGIERTDILFKTFYLTGGTLLKARGIVPRMSNDLDFFTFPLFDHRIFMSRLREFHCLLDGIFGAEHIITTERGFIHHPSGMIIDVIADEIPNIDEFVLFGKLSTSGLKDIAANKASALCSRDEIKDYVDVAFLTRDQGWSLKNLEEFAEKKFRLGTVTEEKLVTEILSKQSLFTLPAEIFLREPEKNLAIVQEQIAHLLETSTL
ncbi:MAG: nucleotidyl transferase AbiEii/AbiGii toxin family protein [Candidatus Uhrbacteria bacterium]|nr:nucleotidyl transferase AbiEii/AbiGii toxin family protein [Candidatus Uhrbacteria bacterium]